MTFEYALSFSENGQNGTMDMGVPRTDQECSEKALPQGMLPTAKCFHVPVCRKLMRRHQKNLLSLVQSLIAS